MSNLICNRFEVEGSKEGLARFIAGSCVAPKGGTVAIDFKKVVSPPKARMSADDARIWRYENWGASYIEDIEIVERSETFLVMRFVTPNAPPYKVYQALASQYPDLRILAEATDEGNDIGYSIAAQHGKFTETYPKLTLKFVLHVTGDPPGDVELDPEAVARQTRPAHGPLLASLLGLHDRLVLSRRYPLWPLAARRYRRMEAQLSDYPIYMPPYRQHAEYLVRRKAQANFDYFIETKPERLEFFGSFLGRFNIQYGFTDKEVLNIVKWYERNIYYILPYRRKNYHLFEALEGFKQSWDGPLRGLNVIVDFATFLGECILDRAPQAQWEMAIEDRNFGEHTPVIGGLTRYYPVVSIVNGNAMNRAIDIRFNNYNYRYDILREMPYLNVLRL